MRATLNQSEASTGCPLGGFHAAATPPELTQTTGQSCAFAGSSEALGLKALRAGGRQARLKNRGPQ